MTTPAQFGPEFDKVISRAGSVQAAFGRNVLDALVVPLREATHRPRTERNWGPGVLGCAMWMDDPELIDVLAKMANACVVITKQQQKKYGDAKFRRLESLARSSGLAHAAYPELDELAPSVDGRARVVGPYGSASDADIGAVRELGFRRVGQRLVPIVHAKILLLGSMGWTDEHPSGHVVDQLFFVPERLWIGSANFTSSSRHSLEMGVWTTDPVLLRTARRWLLGLVAQSEPLRSPSDDLHPELLPVEYDNEAFAEYLREHRHDPEVDLDDEGD